MNGGAYILVLNGGSSSLKFALFKDNEHNCVGRGIIAEIGKKARFSCKGPQFEGKYPPDVAGCDSPGSATKILLKWLEEAVPPGELLAVGHRVVHGRDFKEHMVVRPHILAYLNTLIPLAPLHQPFNVEVIERVLEVYPKVPQIACFDTAFHATIPSLHRRYAIPRIWDEKGVRRYGFHGLSYEYISGRLREVSPRAYNGRAVVAHMGNGASLCALDKGKSFDTSMGFSVLEGLVMGTRPGNLDVGVLLYFMREAKLDEKAIERMLYHDSGLKGVSGITSDMSELLSSREPAAREAVDLFCLRATREIGAFISMLGGVDALVFTGGIGENAAPIRSQIVSSFSWLGVTLDEEKNAAPGSGEVLLSTPQSRIEVWLIPTNEEAVIARNARRLAETAG